MPNNSNAAMVIGIHREELAFGKKVAEKMAGNDIFVVRIDNGLSHERSSYRSGFYHSTIHREMYLQLHQQLIAKKVRLVIDLHTGINETGRCADIMSADRDLLKKMDGLLKGVEKHSFSAPGEERLYEIIHEDERGTADNSALSVCHTIIPQKVWKSQQYIYSGLEIYLRKAGQGSKSDWEYAVGLIRMLMSSHED